MRVTENTNYNTVRDSGTRIKAKMENLQNQSATLKKLNTPSDNPVGSAKLLEMRTDKVNNTQFQSNARYAEMLLDNSDHALADIGDILVRAKEIAISQSSGASSNEQTRMGVAEEVEQLYFQAVAAANRRIGDRFLFAGFKTQTPPIDGKGEYRGDDGQILVEVAKDIFISSNVTGREVFNTNPSSTQPHTLEGEEKRKLASTNGSELSTDENVNVFSEISTLRTGLMTSDINLIRTTLERFDDMHSRILAMRAKIGSRIQGIRSTEQSLERHDITNAMLTSSIEDADMAKVLSDLAKEESVFRNSLQSAQRLIQPSLMSFLK